MEEAGEEAARAPKRHWARPAVLWLLAGALCVLAPNGSALRSLAGSALGPEAAAADADPLPKEPLVVDPADGTVDVMPSTVVTVTSRDPLRKVSVVDEKGTVVGGHTVSTHVWKSAQALLPGRGYRIEIEATADGKPTHRTTTFKTVPGRLMSAAVQPTDGSTVGVGMPVIVKFSAPVKNQSEILRGISVWSASGTEIRAKWFSPYEVHFRPAKYWTPGEHVTAALDLDGLDAGNNIFGSGRQRIGFTVGSARVSTVDVVNHTMTVTEDGKVLRTFPISAGKPKFPTANGIHVVKGKAKTVIMDSSTVGIPRNSPEGYRLTVNWAVQFTLAGSFVHSAPWSVSKQGVENVSHGCINASPANAQWYFAMARVGDIVQVTGSPRQPSFRDGSADWNTAWESWAPQTSTSAHVVAGAAAKGII